MVGRTSAQCIGHSKLLLLIKRQDMLKQPQTLCQHMVRKTQQSMETQFWLYQVFGDTSSQTNSL